MLIEGAHINLRLLEQNDLAFLELVENDVSLWELSNTVTPYGIDVLKEYILNARQDIFEAQQLRLVITDKENNSLGFIDLFDFEPLHHRVGVGVIIYKASNRGKGYAMESLKLVCEYAFEKLEAHQIFANITNDNKASIKLFENIGFKKSGTKIDWIKTKDGFKSESIYQLFNTL
ncbi:acetyltransferase [Patiriisocius marinistellae]|uniref:Acetyltransferase n=1 Tax=Patiriisocius marinistellae TaxID=2494560 RepID=A0A5J4FX98_9FLAO|nr:GNAT family N-acetyltransferase [Patiriisocius marinistellae]GEQ86673.1 acetyltransferase [Patiriisocius marinistellae]